MGGNLVIYYNDDIDSDNLAAAMALFKATYQKQNTRVLWILEPRQVCFGLSMTKAQMDRCIFLIEQCFPSVKSPFKTLLNGAIKMEDINDIKDLTPADREILEKAVRPQYGSTEDAIQHAHLGGMDLASCLAEWSDNGHNEVFVDYETLLDIENPVNLHMHHHEELANRSEGEIRAYNRILTEVPDFDLRTVEMRDWYSTCIERLKKKKDISNTTVEPLVLGHLLSQIQDAKSVRFFGGSSLQLLRRLLDEGVTSKIKCHLQVGTCDMAKNHFPNQFNIALNQQAAKIVLSRHTEFAEFTVVPSHTAQSITYPALGLQRVGGRCMESRILGFNCREEPLKIVTNQVSVEREYPNKFYTMPDLTSFLCALVPGHMGSESKHIKIEEQEGGTLLFKLSEEGIPIFDLDGDRELKESEVTRIFDSLARDKALL